MTDLSNSHDPKGYVYLKRGPGRAKADVLEDNYRLGQLSTRPVIKDTYNKKYRVFESWDDFWSWRETVPPNRQCFDEVVFGGFPQRIKFDVDAPDYKIDLIPVEKITAFTGRRPAPDPKEKAELESYVSSLLGVSPKEQKPVAPSAEKVRQDKVDAIMDGLIETILDELEGCYYALDDLVVTRDDLAVTDSSGSVGQHQYKYSYHIVVTSFAVANNEEAKSFTSRVLDQLPAQVRELVDPGVNLSIQHFRLAGSSKPNTGRVKRVTTRYHTANISPRDTVVRAPPGARILTRLCTEVSTDGKVSLLDASPHISVPEISGGDLSLVLDAAKKTNALDGHEYVKSRGGLLLFRRTRPSHCSLCKRVHDNDNTLMLTIEPADSDAPTQEGKVPHMVVEHCRRAASSQKSNTTRVLATVAIDRRRPFDLAPAKSGTAERQRESHHSVKSRISAIKGDKINVHHSNCTEMESVSERHVYAESQMRTYEPAPTLVVKAQMKLGKTKALRDYLDRDFPTRPGDLRVPVIRMITFRQTFSKSMQRDNFPDFELYSDHKGDLDHIRFPRLIIQVESLYRLKMGDAPEPVDLLILDEVESILAQFNSGLHRNLNAAFAMFQWMLQTAGRVVCMDANVGDRTYHILRRMRPKHPVTFHWNQFQRAADDKYYFTAQQHVWLDHLYTAIKAGKRIVLPTNSLSEAETFEASIRSKFPGKTVRLYSSRTPPSEKERHFADVHKHWSSLDVLIYTPTVSAGVSYEMERFDMLFGYFTDASCDVETCRQMLGRVRNIGTKKHFVCLSGRANHLPTNVEDIKRLIFDKRTNLYRRMDNQLALQFEYTPNGEIRYHESPYFLLWLESMRMTNLSKNEFVSRFIDQVADTGASVDHLPELPGSESRLPEIRLGQKDLKKELAKAECESVASAPDLLPEEAASVRARMRHQEDVSRDEQHGLAKYRLRETYHWHEKKIDGAFVEKYYKPGVVRVYKNLVRITAASSIVDALRNIQAQEAGDHRMLMDARVPLRSTAKASDTSSTFESLDLHRRYVFQSHYLALWLMRMCGFRCLTDDAVIREEVVYWNIKDKEEGLLRSLEQISFEFGVRRANPRTIAGETEFPRYIAKVLRIVNPVLRKMYSVSIRRLPKRRGGKDYYLHTALLKSFFTWGDSTNASKPNIPSKLTPVWRTSDTENFMSHYFYDNIDQGHDIQDPPRPVPKNDRGGPPALRTNNVRFDAGPQKTDDTEVADFLGAMLVHCLAST
jgi:hypothetical protein